MMELPTGRQIKCLAALLGLFLVATAADAVTPSSAPVAAKSAATRSTPQSTSADNLAWSRLSAAQRQALQPLAVSWPTLSETQKKKWFALSANYATLSAPAKERLHARMADWAALTPKQRTQARLNFSQTQAVPPEDKAERWEIYQTLTLEQKQALAASAPKVPLAPHVKVPKKPASASASASAAH